MAMMNVDSTIEQVERLYESVTGRTPPQNGEPYAPIPPEQDPVRYVEEQMQRLQQLLETTPVMPSAAAVTAPPAIAEPSWTPAIATCETELEYVLWVDVPGVAKNKVNLSCEGSTLQVRGERAVPAVRGEETQVEARWCEHPAGRFSRTIPLPADASTEGVKAQLLHGVLEVHVPRLRPAARGSRTIPVS